MPTAICLPTRALPPCRHRSFRRGPIVKPSTYSGASAPATTCGMRSRSRGGNPWALRGGCGPGDRLRTGAGSQQARGASCWPSGGKRPGNGPCRMAAGAGPHGSVREESFHRWAEQRSWSSLIPACAMASAVMANRAWYGPSLHTFASVTRSGWCWYLPARSW